MRISKIVLKLRLGNTVFGNNIGGATELSRAIRHAPTKDIAFVIPVDGEADEPVTDAGIQQKVTERFAVVCALKNDTSDKDRQGILAYDRLHDIRAEIWKALLGWRMEIEDERLVYYRREKLVGVTPATLWYQYEFEVQIRIIGGVFEPETNDSIDGVELEFTDSVTGQTTSGRAALQDFNKVFMQLVIAPTKKSEDTKGKELPLQASQLDMENLVDLSEDPNAGSFFKGFGSGYDKFTGG